MILKTFFLSIILSTSLVFSFLILGNQSIRLDEAQSIWVATKPPVELLRLVAKDVHTPLYFLTLHFWIQLFGNNLLIIRFLSFSFFILTLPFLYILLHKVANQKIALLTLTIYTISPFLVWYSFEARMYSLVVLFAVLSHLSFIAMMESRGKRGSTWYIVFSVLGLYTHYFYAFLIVSQIAYTLYKFFGSKKMLNISKLNGKPGKQKFLKPVYLSVVTLLMFLPWVYYMNTLGGAQNTQPLIPVPTSYSFLQAFSYFLFGYQPDFLQNLFVTLWPVASLFLIWVFTKGFKFQTKYLPYFLMVTFLPMFIAFILSSFRPLFLPRYLIYVVPTLLLLITAGLEGQYSQKWSGLTKFFIFIVFMLLILSLTDYYNPAKEDYRRVAELVNTEAKVSDIVLVSAPFTIYPIEYYYKGQAKIDTFPKWNRFEIGSIQPFKIKEFDEQLSEYQNTYRRLYLILSYDQGYEDELRDQLDNNYEILDRQKFSDNIEISIYKLFYGNEVSI